MRTLIVIAGVGLLGCSSSYVPPPGQKPEPSPNAPAITTAAYPTGEYGFKEGMIVPSGLTFTGVGSGGQPVTFTSADFFDSDGSKGINAVIFDTSAQWCGACQQEAATLENHIATSWGADGVTIVTLMIESNKMRSGGGYEPSTETTAQEWMKDFHLTNVPVLLDHNQTFFPPGVQLVGLPNNTLVDPRTMKVVKNPLTNGTEDSKIADLVATNKAAH